MAAMIMVTVVVLLLTSVGALTTRELAEFYTRVHSEQNTNQQGLVLLVTTDVDYYRIVSNGIPDHATGTFPATSNPNSITQQSHSKRFPKNPSFASAPKCLPKGPIAFGRNGVPLLNPYNAQGENAVEGSTAEVFDSCDGHPDMMGVYHYHQTPGCLYGGGNDEFVGVALDGFPIYGIKDSNGIELKSSDLDTCHGREENGEYRYRMTRDFPYIMGCFKGTPSPDIPDRMFEDRDCKIAGSSGTTMVISVLMLITLLTISLTEVF